ncbi:MAG TPA: DUF485 domain-containing protein [Vicinamibacterales bacterium]|nr:DUF485 domain-containing protein [Vicinamibacterales bacterium]
MKTSVRDVLDSPEFRGLVARRWRVSMILSGLLFVLYYGYIILIATNPHLLSRRVGASTTVGILMAAAVIAGAWVLTAVYVIWANRHYDPEVARLRRRLLGD